MAEKFRVGITNDFLTSDGDSAFGDIGLDVFDSKPGLGYEFFDEYHAQATPEQLANVDAVITLYPQFNENNLCDAERLTLVARFGVGYDMIDVEACTQNDVILAITPEGVRRGMAEGSLALMLALAKQLFPKSQLLREGRWQDSKQLLGCCLTDKAIGAIGLGNIGADLMQLVIPFQPSRRLAYDPHCPPEQAAAWGVELVDLDTLLSESDFVSIHCLLNDTTRGLVGEREVNLMKPTAFLVNTARGPIIDQQALTTALRERTIRGAALDVFEVEPIDPADPLLELDNLIPLPHSVGGTAELYLGNGRGACQAALDVFHGRAPQHVVNQEVLERPGLKKKLKRYAERSS